MMTEWTDQRVAKLTQMWGAGETAAKIASAVGLSRDGVIGKAHRLGLAGRPSPIKRNVALQTTRRTVGQYKDRSIITFLPESPRLEMEFRHLVADQRQKRGAAWTEMVTHR
jgi:hypothetical protein